MSGGVTGTRGQRVYGQHGSRHSPRGSDPSPTDVWIYVGVDPRVPFVNGTNVGGGKVPARFRISVGPPNECEYDGWDSSTDPVASAILAYTDHQIEIQAYVTDLVIGDTVFVIPLEFQHDYDVPYHTHDLYGAYVPCLLFSTGEFVWGQV